MALPIFAVPREFDPRRIALPSQWIDASDSSTLYTAATGGSLVAADGTVGRAEDKSGNGRHVTQSTANNRPLRKLAAVSGLDALLFSGLGTALASPTFSVPQPATLVLVASVNSTGAGSPFRSIIDGTPGRTAILQGNPATDLLARDYSASGTSAANQWVTGVPLVVSWVVNGASSRLRSNAVQRATATAAAGDVTTPILGGADSTGAFGFVGHLCEFLLYPLALTTAQAEYVERGLMAKWRA